MKNKIIKYDDYYIMLITRRNGDTFEIKLSPKSIQKLETFKYKWFIRHNKSEDNYYVVATVYNGLNESGKPIYTAEYLHRYVTNAKDYHLVDHKNLDTLDNRLNNLRLVDRRQNAINRSGANSNNKSGYRNVSWNKYYEKWVVQLQIDGKNNVLGMFDDVHEAGAFAENMREKYYKESIK